MSTTAPLVLRFDPHQFAGRRTLPVSGSFIAGNIQSFGIGFDDYERMHVQEMRLNQCRRKDAPEWAYNYSQLRELIVRYCERYAGMFQVQFGTHAERLERCRARLKERRGQMIQVITRLNHEYVELKRSDPQHPRLRVLEIEIENRDVQLSIQHRLPEVVLGVVQRYYHQGLNSVECSAALQIKPPHVRQLLFRLNQTWKGMPHTPKERAAELAALQERKDASEARAKARRDKWNKRAGEKRKQATEARTQRRSQAEYNAARRQAAEARKAERERIAKARKRERKSALVERNTRIVARFNLPASGSFTARTRAVAVEFGVSAATVRAVLATPPALADCAATTRKATLDERNARIVARFKAYAGGGGGGSYSARARAVAAEFGISGSAVRYVLAKQKSPTVGTYI